MGIPLEKSKYKCIGDAYDVASRFIFPALINKLTIVGEVNRVGVDLLTLA